MYLIRPQARQERANSVPQSLRPDSSEGLMAMSVERHRRSTGDLAVLAANGKAGYWHLEDGFDLNVSPAHKRRRTTIRRPQTSKAPGDLSSDMLISPKLKPSGNMLVVDSCTSGCWQRSSWRI